MNDLYPIEPVATAYTVCALPEDNVNHSVYAIKVERTHHSGTWAVRWMGRCLNHTGEWDYEPIPSGREDDWLEAHRFDLATALKLAVDKAPTIVVNGFSVTDALERARKAAIR